jgi:membrane associated rhomboid family serine protease
VLMFLVSALAVILFFRLFPEQVILVYLFVGAIGLIFGFLSYLPFKDLSDKKRSSK